MFRAGRAHEPPDVVGNVHARGYRGSALSVPGGAGTAVAPAGPQATSPSGNVYVADSLPREGDACRLAGAGGRLVGNVPRARRGSVRDGRTADGTASPSFDRPHAEKPPLDVSAEGRRTGTRRDGRVAGSVGGYSGGATR
ncbi:hypothetical protein K933_10989 [Candidatus Halobonum tyrrellensis G22]|uniref:Uncharacterized protein n=1 Tax=Candidatus Halobonum tyrrellensis G22 TaxID=1324957 RepID=V4HBI0_9EURY|nr:hypothetical protein K933_10989 [Candidatus Halobonum tyrrellensis G22]